MPTVWDPETDRKLLLAALDPENKPVWATVATAMGGESTSEGVRQRYAKLKREAAALGNSDSSATAEAPKAVTPKTPRKRKAATDTPNNTPKKTRTPRKKKGAQDDKATDNNGAPKSSTQEEVAAKTEDGGEVIKTDVDQEDNDAEPTAVKSETKEDA